MLNNRFIKVDSLLHFLLHLVPFMVLFWIVDILVRLISKFDILRIKFVVCACRERVSIPVFYLDYVSEKISDDEYSIIELAGYCVVGEYCNYSILCVLFLKLHGLSCSVRCRSFQSL